MFSSDVSSCSCSGPWTHPQIVAVEGSAAVAAAAEEDSHLTKPPAAGSFLSP